MIELFEDDEFPIYVDIANDTVSCQGFCMQCCMSNKHDNCKDILIGLGKVKDILLRHDCYEYLDIYSYDYYSNDYIEDLIFSLECEIENFEANSEVVCNNEKIVACIEELQRHGDVHNVDKL